MPENIKFGNPRVNEVASLDPDYDLAIGTYSAIWPRYERSGLGGLRRAERAAFLVHPG